MKPEKNLDRKGNSKGFHAGTVPEKFAPDDVIKGTGGEKNKIGATSEPNQDKNKVYEKKLKTPRDPALNAVPMPNKNKGNTKNYGVLSFTGDEAGKYGAHVPVGGVPRPNHIS